MPGRVLLAEESATNRRLIRLRLSAAYYDVIEAADGESALALAASDPPDIVLLDLVMPGMDGYAVCTWLKRNPLTAHIPVVMLTAREGRADRLRALETGADDFLTKPVDEVALLSRVASLTRMKMMIDELALRGETAGIGSSAVDELALTTRFPESRVLVVGADRGSAAGLASEIAGATGADVGIAAPEEVSAMAGDAPPDAVLFDCALGGADPLRLGSAVRSRPATRQVPTLLVVPPGDAAMAAKALEIGFSDYLGSPVDPAELAARMRLQLRRKGYADRLRETVRTRMADALTDPLTGVWNRRYANAHLEAIIDRCRDRGADVTMMALDLDRFKAINDSHGHDAGDRVLREFARRLQSSVRSVDLVARMGGEEFMVIMPDAGADAAAEIAERVRQATEDPPFAISETGERLLVTVSIGFAVLQPRESVFELIRRADRALYSSKTGGRNRATLSDAA